MISVERLLKDLSNKERAKVSASFFKTGKGEYGEGDVFFGVTVPQVRKLIKEELSKVTLNDLLLLLKNKYHEVRLFACISFVELMKNAIKEKNEKKQKAIFDLYIKNLNRINNWDLVDTSCRDIVGYYLYNKNRDLLYKLAKSDNLWERRVAIVSTWYFIKNKEYEDTFSLCELLINDKEDLMHKACGWMLREVGKYCGLNILNIFLEKNADKMPRTALRYSLERHNHLKREYFLKIK